MAIRPAIDTAAIDTELSSSSHIGHRPGTAAAGCPGMHLAQSQDLVEDDVVVDAMPLVVDDVEAVEPSVLAWVDVDVPPVPFDEAVVPVDEVELDGPDSTIVFVEAVDEPVDAVVPVDAVEVPLVPVDVVVPDVAVDEPVEAVEFVGALGGPMVAAVVPVDAPAAAVVPVDAVELPVVPFDDPVVEEVEFVDADDGPMVDAVVLVDALDDPAAGVGAVVETLVWVVALDVVPEAVGAGAAGVVDLVVRFVWVDDVLPLDVDPLADGAIGAIHQFALYDVVVVPLVCEPETATGGVTMVGVELADVFDELWVLAAPPLIVGWTLIVG